MLKRRVIAQTIAALALTSSLGSSMAYGAQASHAGPIKALYPLAYGTYVLVFDASMSACSGSPGQKYLYIEAGQHGVTAEGLKQLVATAMLAFATERTVNIVYDDATAYCYVNRLSVE